MRFTNLRLYWLKKNPEYKLFQYMDPDIIITMPLRALETSRVFFLTGILGALFSRIKGLCI